ncbi:MAG TPA: hypothetical protein VF055_01725 [Steroidobacteraceae bacterium]
MQHLEPDRSEWFATVYAGSNRPSPIAQCVPGAAGIGGSADSGAARGMQTCTIAYVFRGTGHGQSVRCESQAEGRTRDARTQARHVEDRLRQDREEPKTGDSDRPVRGTSGRWQGAGAQEEGRLEPQPGGELTVENELQDDVAPQDRFVLGSPKKEQQLVVAGPEEPRLTAPVDLQKACGTR